MSRDEDIEMKKWKKLGDTRVWTKDLSICSRMLYHWAISPVVNTNEKGNEEMTGERRKEVKSTNAE